MRCVILKPITWTRHAVAKLFKVDFSKDQIEAAVVSGLWVWEGKTKFKVVSRKKPGLLIVVCAEYPDRICIITVIQKSG